MIVITGVGALGSHLVQFIRNEKTAIRVVDFDRVEQKNVLSQFYGRPGVGKNKVLALVGGDIYTVSSEIIHGGTVLVKDGKILKVGQDVEIPEGATVVDVKGKYISPGFVALSMAGVALRQGGGPGDAGPAHSGVGRRRGAGDVYPVVEPAAASGMSIRSSFVLSFWKRKKIT